MTPGGGKVDVSGIGAGVNATTTAGGAYIDVQAVMSLYDVDLTSKTGRKLADSIDGTGYALAVEVGRPVAVAGGLSVTPRAGLAWSEASPDDFTDLDAESGHMSVEDADSLVGRTGVSLESDVGDGLRLTGSVDVMQEFREETKAQIGGTPLKASARKTRFRASVGGVRVWGEGRYTLGGSVGYAAGGDGNRELGGGLSLSIQF